MADGQIKRTIKRFYVEREAVHPLLHLMVTGMQTTFCDLNLFAKDRLAGNKPKGAVCPKCHTNLSTLIERSVG